MSALSRVATHSTPLPSSGSEEVPRPAARTELMARGRSDDPRIDRIAVTLKPDGCDTVDARVAAATRHQLQRSKPGTSSPSDGGDAGSTFGRLIYEEVRKVPNPPTNSDLPEALSCGFLSNCSRCKVWRRNAETANRFAARTAVQCLVPARVMPPGITCSARRCKT